MGVKGVQGKYRHQRFPESFPAAICDGNANRNDLDGAQGPRPPSPGSQAPRVN